MQNGIKSEVMNIATAEKAKAIGQKNWSDDSVDVWGLSDDIVRLASAAYRTNVSNLSALPAFFTPDAAMFLLKLPNWYWFWSVVEVVTQFTFSSTEKITLTDIRHAINSTFRKELEVQHVRLDRSIHVVSPAEASYLMEKGVVQMKEEDGKIELLRNPMFELR